MAHNRHNWKKDDNHTPIVKELEKRGFVVFDVSGLKSLGFDIIVCKRDFVLMLSGGNGYTYDRWQPFEIKQPNRKDKLTESQVKAQLRAPIPVVSSMEEILRYF